MTSYRRPRRGRKRSRGVALVMVLWLIVLMSVLAVGSVRVVGAETRSLATHLERVKARAIAEAGVNRAILDLLAPERSWRTDGTPTTLEFAGQRMVVSVRPEGGLVDLNRADGHLIDSVLKLAGLDDPEREQLADAVLDWRDPDDFARLHGAEAGDYAGAGLAWEPRNAPFKSVEELRYVWGMTAEIYGAVAPFFTVHSGRSGVEIESAPPALVEVLTGRQIVDDEDPPSDSEPRARGTFHITVDVPLDSRAMLELSTVVRIGAERGGCCRTLLQRERTRPRIDGEGMNAI